jgi:O-antigen/teichoic acid export membrane protein
MSQSIYKKIVQDIGIIGIANILQAFSGLILIPVITKILGVHDYGLYVQFYVTIALITGFTTLGLPYATVRFLAGVKDKEQIQDDVYSSIVLIFISSLIVSFFLILFSSTIAEYLFGGSIIFVRILAIIIPIECIGGTLLNLFRVFQKIKKYTIFTIIKTYTELAVIVMIIFAGYGIIEVALSVLIIRFLLLIVLAVIITSGIGIRVPRFSRMIEYFKFSIPTIPANVAGWVTNSSDRYIIAIFLGVTFVGYYNPGYALGGLILMFMTPVDFVLVAVVAKYYEEQKIDVVRDIFKYAIKYFLLLAIPAFFGLSILSKPILTILSTPELAEQGYLVTPFIAFSMVLTGLGGVAIGKSLYLAKKTHISMMNGLIVAGTNFGLNMLLIPTMGIIGAAIATMAAFLAGSVFGFYFAFKYFDFDIDWLSLAKILIASIIMSIIIINFHPVTIMELLFTILVGLVTYVAIIVLLKTINKDEITFFKSFANTKTNHESSQP